ATEKETVLHRIDVRQSDQIADNRADRGAAATTRWQSGAAAHRTLTSHTLCHRGGLLLQIPIDEKEPGEVVLANQLQFIGELASCFSAQCRVSAIGRITIVKPTPAKRGQHFVG